MLSLHGCTGLLWLRWVGTALCLWYVASLCSGFSCCGARALRNLGLRSCGSLAQQLWHMGLVAWGTWDRPGPGVELVSPALASGFFTTEPPGKPYLRFLSGMWLPFLHLWMWCDFSTLISVSILNRLPWWLSGKKNLPANAGDMGLIPGLGRSPGEGNGNALQYSCLGNPMDRGAWRVVLLGVSKELDMS